MDIVKEKKRLLEQLAKTEDVDIIQKVRDVLNKSSQGEFMGYNPDGSGISESDLLDRAEIANQAIKKGKTKTIDQVREEMKKW